MDVTFLSHDAMDGMAQESWASIMGSSRIRRILRLDEQIDLRQIGSLLVSRCWISIFISHIYLYIYACNYIFGIYSNKAV
jgi:hypothetical protein